MKGEIQPYFGGQFLCGEKPDIYMMQRGFSESNLPKLTQNKINKMKQSIQIKY
jgi:hypothetical protein